MSTSDRETTLRRLRAALERFIADLERLPSPRFLSRSNQWSPRDVAAHLIGWHRLTVEGCEELRRGITPSYFADAQNDYANVNEGLIRRCEATDRGELIDELRGSFVELDVYLRSLPVDAWSADTGVRYRGESTTIANSVAALIGDVDAHRKELHA